MYILQRLLGIRRHHFVGAGFLASAIGLYSFAARLGFVPADINTAVRWVSNSSGPLLPGAEINTVGPAGYGVPQSAAYPNSPNGYGATNYQAGAYPNGAYPNGAYPNSSYATGYPPAAGGGDIACYFSPSGGCTDAIVANIRQARQQILVQAYSFTSAPIAGELVEAHRRGVRVFVVLDKSQKTEQYSSADFVAHAGIPTLIDAKHAIAHNKIMLIDGHTIITGSFNFSKSAEQSNAENLLIIRNHPDLYQAYESNFRHHYEHSEPYQARGVSGQQPAGKHQTTSAGQYQGAGQHNGYSQAEAPRGWSDPGPQTADPRGSAGYPYGSYSR